MTIRDTVGSGHLVGRPPRQQFHPRKRQLPLLWPNRAPARSKLRSASFGFIGESSVVVGPSKMLVRQVGMSVAKS